MELYRSLTREITTLLQDSRRIITTLFRIMIPALLIVKVLEMLGATTVLSNLLAPLMGLIGLPESAALVWATTLLTNIYTGMAIFFTSTSGESWSVAQVSILATMMLMAHNLPIELSIAKKAGCRLAFQLLLRVSGALLIAALLNQLYLASDYLQQPNQLQWTPETTQVGLAGWAIQQLQALLATAVVITALVFLLRILRLLHIEKLLNLLLRPVMRLLGIADNASSLTLIGLTLGLAYGGGLLIQEAKKGVVTPRDIFISISLLSLCHSLIEDTLLVMLLGADLSAILWARLVISLAVIWVLAKFCDHSNTHPWMERWLFHSVATKAT